MRNYFLVAFFLLFINASFSQELLDLLEDEPVDTTIFTDATFKSTRIVSGQSIENVPKGDLIFVIQHRFGRMDDGIYELFGLDQATERLGLEYGITDRLTVSFARSTYKKNYDGFVKYKVLRQCTGKRSFPFTLSYLASININSLKWSEPDRENYFSSRISYVHQIMIARKISSGFSFQVTPGIVHRNLVATKDISNDVFYVGLGSRYKITNRLTLNGEYFIVPKGQLVKNYKDAISIGIDLDTGGHIFQLHITNTQPMYESGIITESTGDFFKGEIHFGFNITRVFTLK